MESEKEHELKEQKDSLAIEFHKRITELQAELDKKESELEELRGVLASKQEGANKVGVIELGLCKKLWNRIMYFCLLVIILVNLRPLSM